MPVGQTAPGRPRPIARVPRRCPRVPHPRDCRWPGRPCPVCAARSPPTCAAGRYARPAHRDPLVPPPPSGRRRSAPHDRGTAASLPHRLHGDSRPRPRRPPHLRCRRLPAAAARPDAPAQRRRLERLRLERRLPPHPGCDPRRLPPHPGCDPRRLPPHLRWDPRRAAAARPRAPGDQPRPSHPPHPERPLARHLPLHPFCPAACQPCRAHQQPGRRGPRPPRAPHPPACLLPLAVSTPSGRLRLVRPPQRLPAPLSGSRTRFSRHVARDRRSRTPGLSRAPTSLSGHRWAAGGRPGRAARAVPAAVRAAVRAALHRAPAPGMREGHPARLDGPLERLSGGVLLSHTVPRAVPSALKGLASGFGMGPGVSLTL